MAVAVRELPFFFQAEDGIRDYKVTGVQTCALPETSRLEHWDLNREMSFRIAWKPYMYNTSLPHLLGGVATPTLVVWGRDDRIVPLECGERYAKALPRARLEVVDGAGHFLEMEKPHELAQLVTNFVSQGEA